MIHTIDNVLRTACVFILMTIAFVSQGQKHLTQIEFFRLDPNQFHESATRLDTFAYIVQVIPAIYQKPGAYDVYVPDHHVIFEDKVENDLVKIEYRTTKSDFSKRIIDYNKQTIDGTTAYGHDGFDASKLSYIMQNYISDLSITVNNHVIAIDPKVYRNFFSGYITRAMKVLDRDLIILQISGGDGAGHYEAYLLFNSKGLVGRCINNGDIYFTSSPDYFSKTKKFDYDILCHYDEWPYFPKHNVTNFLPQQHFPAQDSALIFARSVDLSALIKSDTVYADYGMAMSPKRYERLHFFIADVTQYKDDPGQYELSGILKDGNSILTFTGKQVISQAKFEKGGRGAFIVQGTFLFNVKYGEANSGTMSGLWTYHIKELKHVSAIPDQKLRSVSLENIFKSYSGVMTNVHSTDKELLKFGNATVAGNWFGTPVDNQWWKPLITQKDK